MIYLVLALKQHLKSVYRKMELDFTEISFTLVLNSVQRRVKLDVCRAPVSFVTSSHSPRAGNRSRTAARAARRWPTVQTTPDP